MKIITFLLALGGLVSCSSWHPIATRQKAEIPSPPSNQPGLTATFYGNTTLLISDGETRLMVDGFFTRPSGLNTLLGRIEPDKDEINKRLKEANIHQLDAILVGHAHHDHALDAPTVSSLLNHPKVYGSSAYGHIHRGHLGPGADRSFRLIPDSGKTVKIGKFTVSFIPSDHVSSQHLPQKWVEGSITQDVPLKARFHRYKCGPIFALVIEHEQGSIAVTTSAGAKENQFRQHHADVVFLGIGLIAKECPCLQQNYWNETVNALNPQVIAPVHWDDFSKKIGKSGTALKPMPRYADDTLAAFTWVRQQAATKRVTILDYGESIQIQNGKVH